MSEMRQPQEPTRFRQLLFQDIEEKLTKLLERFFLPLRRRAPRQPVRGAAFSGCLLLALCACTLVFPSCTHQPEALISESLSPEAGPEKNTRIFDLNEKVLLKGIARVCKERGFTEVTVIRERNRVETGYLVEDDIRTKIVASVKKISRQEREVTVSVHTERKSSSSWEPKKILGKEQYDKLFKEIELQAYRELYKAE